MSDKLSVAEIDQQLKDLVHWERLALHLEDIVYADIEIIKKEHPLMVANQRLALFGKWLNKCTKPTWNKLALALEKADENKLAQQIREHEHLAPGNGHQQERKAADGQGTSQQPAIPVDQEILAKLVKLQESFVNIAANFKKQLKNLVQTKVVELEDVIMLTKEEKTYAFESIDDVTDINLFFRIIFPHYHFLNCHLLVMLAKRFLNPSGVLDDLIQHQKNVMVLKRSVKVKELKQVLESFVVKSPHETPITVKVQDAWDESELHAVEVLLRTMFRLPHSEVLKIFRVVPGSVIIVYLVPHHITESLIRHSQHKTEFMRLTGIISLQVGETYVLREDSNEEGDHEEYSFETALMEAVGMGNREAVTFLLEHVHVDINTKLDRQEVELLKSRPIFSSSYMGSFTPLLIAYCCENTDMIQLLLDSNADPDISLDNGLTVLHFTCCDDCLEILEHLVEANANLNVQESKHNETPLFIASQKGHSKMVDRLLLAKADSDICRSDGATPLFIASENNRLEVIVHLLQAKANPDIPREDGVTPLYIACEKGHYKAVQKLLKANANPNVSLANGATPIFIASWNGHVKIVEMLIQAKANPDTPLDDGATALFVASQNGHSEVVELLLQMANANPNSPRKDGVTPLYIASQHGFAAVVQKLLQAKAILDIPTSDDGSTPLHIASLDGHLAVVDLLLSANANTEVVMDIYGITPLYIASKLGHSEIVKRLLQSKANPNTPTYNSSTPIYAASSKGHLEVVEALLEANAIADIPDDNGLTPLFVASREGHFMIVQKLLEAKANPDVVNHLGETPLFIACKNGHVEVIKRLLQANADLNSPSLEGVTPPMIANEHRQSKVVELIEQYIISPFNIN